MLELITGQHTDPVSVLDITEVPASVNIKL